MNTFSGKLGFQQRVLPTYRAPLFDALAERCRGGMGFFAGLPQPSEAIQTTTDLKIAQYSPAKNQHFLNPSSSLYLCRQPNLIAWLEAWQPDALIVEANPRYLSTPQAVAWMHARNKPVLGWGLGAPPLHGPLSSIRHRARRKLLFSLDGVISYSQRGAQEYRDLGLPADKVWVAHNAATPPPTAPPPQRPEVFSGPPMVLFVGRLQIRKRLDLLFKACAQQETRPRLVIVGDGPARDQFAVQAAQSYPQAEFVGAKHGAELAKYFGEADLFVLPGTGGLAVQQAMSHGLPVLVAQGDGTQEDLVQGGNGWLVPPDDLQALTSTLDQALSDPARLRRMGAESYRITKEEINLETMLDAFILALNSAASSTN